MGLYRALRSAFSARKDDPPGTEYVFDVLTSAAELSRGFSMPAELRYVCARDPAIKGQAVSLLNAGKAVGARRIARTPERTLRAVHTIAVLSQHRLVSPWLRPLIRAGAMPRFTEEDLRAAADQGYDLSSEARIIRDSRLDFATIVVLDERRTGNSTGDDTFLERANAALEPLALEIALNRLEFDNAHQRTETAQAILKALLIIGPITHVLELYTHGIGKLFAASSDDVMSEVAELHALRGSGFTWKQLMARSKVLIPVLLLAAAGAYEVDDLIAGGNYMLGGILFGLCAVALSLTTAVQSIGMYKRCVDKACREQKIPPATSGERWRIAVHQDFTNPARLGLLLGACVSPAVSMAVFVGFPQGTHNGWILATLGTMETIVAGFTVILAKRLNVFRLRRTIRKHFLE